MAFLVFGHFGDVGVGCCSGGYCGGGDDDGVHGGIIFTESAPRSIQSISCDVRLAVHVWKPRFPVDWRLLVKDCTANIGIPLEIFAVLPL